MQTRLRKTLPGNQNLEIFKFETLFTFLYTVTK